MKIISMPVKKELLEVLACPVCKGDVVEKEMFLVCEKCKKAYPVLGGRVPDMLIDDAWPLGKAEKAGFKHKLKF